MLVIAQTLFVGVGIYALDFSITYTEATIAVLAAVVTEMLFTRTLSRFPTSALAIGLGIALFLRASHPFYFVLAAVLAIASKHLIKHKGGHIFNPSNFGIVCAVLLIPTATIEFTQWGTNPFVFALFSSIVFFISWRAGALPTVGSFLASYTVLLTFFTLYAPATFIPHHLGILSPTLALFAGFMITDPKTSPQGFYPRILHGIAIACAYFALDAADIRYALFFASFLVTLATFVSRTLVAQTSLLPRFFYIIPNSGAPLLAGVALVLSCAFFVPFQATAYHWSALSPSFVLFGIDSSHILRTPTNPLLTPTTDTGLDLAANTYGAAWGDYNNDGLDDLFVSTIDQPSRLYRNEGSFHFTEVTAQAGITPTPSSSAFFVDYDNDGFLDLFIVTVREDAVNDSGALRVYANTGTGAFNDVTEEVGLANIPLSTFQLGTLSFADYNNDGYVDMLFAGRPRYFSSRQLKKSAHVWATIKAGNDPAFNRARALSCDTEYVTDVLYGEFIELRPVILGATLPISCVYIARRIDIAPRWARIISTSTSDGTDVLKFLLPSYLPYLFKNNAGHFEMVPSFTANVAAHIAKGNATIDITHGKTLDGPTTAGTFFQPLSFDFTQDGRPDIFLAADFGSNVFLANTGDFTFSEETAERGLAYAGSGMGVDIADVDGNGTPDIVVTNALQDYLFTNYGGNFSLRPDILAPYQIGWGVGFLDYNLDGRDDLYIANGTLPQGDYTGPGTLDLFRALYRKDSLYENTPDGFVDVTERDLFTVPRNSKALAVADADNSGTPDLFVGTLYRPTFDAGNVLYRNSSSHHYLKVRLIGTQGNTHAIGATVQVLHGHTTQTRFVVAGSSFYSQHSYTQLFGLGTSTAPVDVIVTWPSGKKTLLSEVAADQTLTIREP